jgi:putative ABC transport system permease protein
MWHRAAALSAGRLKWPLILLLLPAGQYSFGERLCLRYPRSRLETVLRNLSFSFRQIRRQPVFAGTVILTLGLAIGANTAIFSFVNALLIRPFPFHDPGQLVEIHSLRGGQRGKLSMREILDIQEQAPSIESIAAHTGSEGGYNFSGEGKPEEWKTILTTGNLFEVLGTPLAVGAKWPQAVDRQRDYRVILTHSVWQRCFSGSRDVVGKKITLDHAAGYEIHGVTVAGFDYPQGVQVYRSIGGFAAYDKRDSRNLVGVARIRQPHSVGRLQSELDTISRHLAQQFPDTNAGLSFQAVAFRELYSGDVRPYLLVLLGAVGFVLLIACGNVANLLVSRALGREREIAVRVALGAGRSTILWQLLTESLTLAILAAGFGSGLAWWWMKLLRAMIGQQLPEWMVVSLDGRVLLFTAAVAVLAGVSSGLAPAMQFSRDSLGESLKDASRGSSGGKKISRLRDWMIVGEVALAVVLLSGAGLLIHGFLELQSQSKGFRTNRIATFRVALGWKRYTSLELTARYYERALEKLAGLPGIEGVGFISTPPLARLPEAAPTTVQVEGQSLSDALHNPYVTQPVISENYFTLMGIPLKAGRSFTTFDRANTEQVAIVSERLANVLWPGRNPLGQRILYNPSARTPGAWCKVVGVAGNVQRQELGGEPGLEMYVPYRQRIGPNQYMLVKTGLQQRQFEQLAQQAMWSIDPEQSIFDFSTYDQLILDGIWQLRLSRVLLIVFAVVALILAAIGIYGVMSYLVGQRTREMGIRLALGATPSGVRTMVVRRGILLGVFGLAIGLFAAFALGRVLEHSLHGISGADPFSYATAVGVLLAVTFVASAVPAWRASRIDPAIALREE